jgi:hypothetical protein
MASLLEYLSIVATSYEIQLFIDQVIFIAPKVLKMEPQVYFELQIAHLSEQRL